jgi:hypothetical protein
MEKLMFITILNKILGQIQMMTMGVRVMILLRAQNASFGTTFGGRESNQPALFTLIVDLTHALNVELVMIVVVDKQMTMARNRTRQNQKIMIVMKMKTHALFLYQLLKMKRLMAMKLVKSPSVLNLPI